MSRMGPPLGNQNARKHGFYSEVLTETEKLELEEAEDVEGLNGEIAMLRIKLRSLFKNQPDRIDLQMKAISMISRLVKARHSITPEDKERFDNAISNVLHDVGGQLGYKLVPMSPDEIAESDALRRESPDLVR